MKVGQILKFDRKNWNPFYFGDYVIVEVSDEPYFVVRWFDKGGYHITPIGHRSDKHKEGFEEI